MPRYHSQQPKTRHSTYIRAQSNSMLDASDEVLAAASCPSNALPVWAGSHSRHTPSRASFCRFHSYSVPIGKKRCMRTRIDRAEIVPSLLIIYERGYYRWYTVARPEVLHSPFFPLKCLHGYCCLTAPHDVCANRQSTSSAARGLRRHRARDTGRVYRFSATALASDLHRWVW